MSLYLDPNEQKSSKRRESLAIILILAISAYFFFNSYQQVQKRTLQSNQDPTKNISSQKNTAVSDNSSSRIASNSGFNSTGNFSGQQISLFKKRVNEKTVKIETEKYQLEFSPYFASLKKITLKNFKNAKNEPFNITPNLNNINSLPLLYVVEGVNFDKGFTLHQSAKKLVFTQRKNGLTLQKTYTFDNAYDIHLTVKVTNNTNTNITTNGHLVWGSGLGPFLPKENRIQYDKIVTLAYYDSNKQAEKTFSKGELSLSKKVNWVSLDNRYFMVALMPKTNQESIINFTNHSRDNLYNEYFSLGQSLHLSPRSSVDKEFTIYMGPKKSEFLKPYNQDLERVSERGWFFFPLLGTFLIWILNALENIFGNYGVAILVFAVLLRLVFHRLNLQSLIASARQGDLQEKIKAIRDKYPDKQVQNIKTMELYRQEGVSPLKGCLPLLIQIPFFISFYQKLPGVLELVNSHFLWIKDLSSPDALMYLDSFKNNSFLPYRFNLLPVLISLLTVVQTLLTMRSQGNNSASNQQMKIMMYLMPLVFLFILWNAPSALSLYWLGQTVATILGQVYFIKNKDRILENYKLKQKNKRKSLAKKIKK